MTHGDERISVVTNPLSGDIWEQGLTKREYFAALAMQGLLANRDNAPVSDFKYAAKYSLQMADALIEALNQNR